jgi:hypothetical protein
MRLAQSRSEGVPVARNVLESFPTDEIATAITVRLWIANKSLINRTTPRRLKRFESSITARSQISFEILFGMVVL